jgi:2-dehydropantoate 2-reductase
MSTDHNPETVAVLGPGGVGGFIAAALDRAGVPVVVVAHEPTAELIQRDGIRVRSVRLGDWTARPRAVARLGEPVGTLVVAPKATGLDAALARIGDGADPGLVVPLLNGLDHIPRLRERFGARVAAGTIRIEADRPQPGVVVHTSPFLVVQVAHDDPAWRPSLERFVATLVRAEIPAEVGDSEAFVLWSKLVRLNAIACTTSAWDRPMGEIRSEPETRAAMQGCVREACAVAAAEGAPIPVGQVIEEIDAVHPTLGSSMQRDLAAGRPPELDAIPGAVLRAAARHGIECPTIAALYERIAQRAGVHAPTARDS